jgi:hypothetical protein
VAADNATDIQYSEYAEKNMLGRGIQCEPSKKIEASDFFTCGTYWQSLKSTRDNDLWLNTGEVLNPHGTNSACWKFEQNEGS